MPTRYVYVHTWYHIRHDLCNLCHRGMPSEVLHLYKLLLHEVRKLIFCSNLQSVVLAHTLYDIKCVAALLIHAPTQGDTSK